MPQTLTVADSRKRSRPLDGVRAFAAYLIVFHHVFFAAGTTSKWKDGVGRFTGRLDIGVPLFFVLSGYLLFRPFLAAILDGRPLPSARTFLTKRFIRIFPAYWIALVIMLCAGAVAVRGYAGFFFSFFLLHIYHPHRAISGITQSWSLATEIAFYLSLPLFARLVQRLTSGKTRNQIAIVTLGSLLAMYAFSLAFRLAVDLVQPSFINITPYWLPAQVDIFALGMFLAVMAEWSRFNVIVKEFCVRIAHLAWLCWSVALVLFFVMATQFQLVVGLETTSFLPETLRQFTYGAVGLLIVAPVALHDAGTRIHRIFGWRPIAWVGLVSYGVYLWHQLLISGPLAEHHMPYHLFDGNVLLRLLIVTSSTLCIASISYYFLEEPLMRAYTRRRVR